MSKLIELDKNILIPLDVCKIQIKEENCLKWKGIKQEILDIINEQIEFIRSDLRGRNINFSNTPFAKNTQTFLTNLSNLKKYYIEINYNNEAFFIQSFKTILNAENYLTELLELFYQDKNIIYKIPKFLAVQHGKLTTIEEINEYLMSITKEKISNYYKR